MAWDPDDMQRTALHEAGHAVVAWSFLVPVEGIHLDRENQSGHSDIASTAHLEVFEQIAHWLAGYEAEQAFKPPGREAKAMMDCGEVSKILRENGTPADQPKGEDLKELGRKCAQERLREHEIRVRRVAGHLIKHHYLHRVAFEAAMRG